jgi:hypothetical protein
MSLGTWYKGNDLFLSVESNRMYSAVLTKVELKLYQSY